jgi:hypothetical protein
MAQKYKARLLGTTFRHYNIRHYNNEVSITPLDTTKGIIRHYTKCSCDAKPLTEEHISI